MVINRTAQLQNEAGKSLAAPARTISWLGPLRADGAQKCSSRPGLRPTAPSEGLPAGQGHSWWWRKQV